MTTPIAKEKSSGPKPPTIKRKPNKMSIGIRPFGAKEPTKAEMYADLKKAVENTR